MKKKLLFVLAALCALALVATVFGPGMILNSVRQLEPAEQYAYSDAFLNDYESVRGHLVSLAADLGAESYSHPIDESDGLYIDTFYLPSAREQTNLIVLTTGVHGIEGYIGSVMLDVFFAEIYPSLNRDNTGVLVVANVKPLRHEIFPPLQRE